MVGTFLGALFLFWVNGNTISMDLMGEYNFIQIGGIVGYDSMKT